MPAAYSSALYPLLALVLVALVAWVTNTRLRLPENAMPVLNVALGLIVVGILLWAINTYVPMAGSIKAILNIVVVIAVCVRVLQVFGLWSPVVRIWNNFRTHRIHRV